VILLGLYLAWRSRRLHLARKQFEKMILVTGSRGKSSTVRLIHAGLLRGGLSPYAKITGSTSVELLTDGSEVSTKRLGSAGIPEMADAMIRAAKHQPKSGVFECMAITPRLISLIQDRIVRADVVVIPTIRLDHLEDEGTTELEIAKNIIHAAGKTQHLFSGIQQPEIRDFFRKFCVENGVQLHEVEVQANSASILGHHPLNVALALGVCEHYGVSREVALDGMKNSSLEPEAAKLWSISETNRTIRLVDLGAANDPQSSAMMLSRMGLGDQGAVIPVLVNRWERPLRAVSFFGLLRGENSIVGATGAFRSFSHYWAKKSGKPLIWITQSLAKQPLEIYDRVTKANGERVTLVLVQNVHSPAADQLRSAFHKFGETETIGDWGARGSGS
jgi:poly-gamma-glutamate synthase PgsB/CapB